jgi:hypothetical protein
MAERRAEPAAQEHDQVGHSHVLLVAGDEPMGTKSTQTCVVTPCGVNRDVRGRMLRTERQA